jgi:CBS domain containing-hemolysin-like protein
VHDGLDAMAIEVAHERGAIVRPRTPLLGCPGPARRSRAFEDVVALVASILFLALNAFFVAAEFALVKVHVVQLDRAARHGDRRAVAAQAVLRRLDRYLSVTQFGITVASLGLGWIGEPALIEIADRISRAITGTPFGHGGHIAIDLAGLAILTFLHLLLGELVPKFVAIQHSEAVTLNAVIPLRIVNSIFSPVLWVLEKAQRAVLRLIRVNPDVASEGSLSEEEIVAILAASARRTGRATEKHRIVERVLRLAKRPVRQMMVPRVDVVFLSVDSTGAKAREVMNHHQLSRILLTGKSLDDVAGYLYTKDLFLTAGSASLPTLRGLSRRALFIPETQNGLAALQELQRSATPFAVVVDEYGGTRGIVTREDLVEEIVGDIREEHDDEPAMVVRIQGDADAWDADASATLDELRDAGVPIDDEDAYGEPIGTIVYKQLGHLPQLGDTVKLAADVVAEIVGIRRRRIERLRVSRL